MLENHEFVLVYEDEEPVAFASYSLIQPGVFKLHKLYVLNAAQGKGIGQSLLDALTKTMRAMNGRTLRLNVNRYNSARKFYEKLGFVVTGEEDIDIGNGYFMNDYVMEKSI
jgi:ribosomal protein S18 acetylase RimI-like enzyme